MELSIEVELKVDLELNVEEELKLVVEMVKVEPIEVELIVEELPGWLGIRFDVIQYTPTAERRTRIAITTALVTVNPRLCRVKQPRISSTSIYTIYAGDTNG